MTSCHIVQKSIDSNSTTLSVIVEGIGVGYNLIFYIYGDGVLYDYYNFTVTQMVSAIVVPITIYTQKNIHVTVYNKDARELSEYSNVVYVKQPVVDYNSMELLLNKVVSKNDLHLQTWINAIIDRITGNDLIPVFINWRNSDGTMNKDFQDIWTSIAEYFSYYVSASKNLNLETNIDFIKEYLAQRGLYLTGQETVDELFTKKIQFYKTINSRGTSLDLPEISKSLKNVDEFQLVLHKNKHTGWKIDYSSPLLNANKFNLFSNTNLGSFQQQSLESFTRDGVQIIKMYPTYGVNNEVFDTTKTIEVNSSLNYSFAIESKGVTQLQVRLYCFDIFGLPCEAVDVKNGHSTNVLINKKTKGSSFTTLKSTIYSFSKAISSKFDTSISNINNLVLSANTKFIQIAIYVDSIIEVKSITFKQISTAKSTGYIDTVNLTSLWIKSSNPITLTEKDVDELKENYLPYNSHILFKDTKNIEQIPCQGVGDDLPIYVFTGKTRCGLLSYIQEEFKDTNICSDTYNRINYIDTSETCSCTELQIDVIEIVQPSIELCSQRDTAPIWELIEQPYCIE